MVRSSQAALNDLRYLSQTKLRLPETISHPSKLVIAATVAFGSFGGPLPAVAARHLALAGAAVHMDYSSAPAENPEAEAALRSLRAWSGTLSVPLDGNSYTAKNLTHTYMSACRPKLIEPNNVYLGIQLSVATVIVNEDFIMVDVKATARAVHHLDTVPTRLTARSVRTRRFCTLCSELARPPPG